MLKKITLSVENPNQLLPANLVHESTSWYIDIVRLGTPNITEKLESSTVYLSVWDTDLDLYDGDILLSSYTLEYRNIVNNKLTKIKSNISRSTFTDTKHVFTGNIICTPQVVASLRNAPDDSVWVDVGTSCFVMYSGGGTHHATNYVITKVGGEVVRSLSNDEVALTSVSFDVTDLHSDVPYVIEVIHVSDMGRRSQAGITWFTKHSVASDHYITTQDDIVSNTSMYVYVVSTSIPYIKFQVLLKDSDGNIVQPVEESYSTDMFFQLTQLSLYTEYVLYGRFVLDDGSTTPFVVIKKGYPQKLDLLGLDQTVEYANTESATQLLTLNGVISCYSEELANGSVLLPSHDKKTLTSYTVNNDGTLFADGLSISTPNISTLPNVAVTNLGGKNFIVAYEMDEDHDNSMTLGMYYYSAVYGTYLNSKLLTTPLNGCGWVNSIAAVDTKTAYIIGNSNITGSVHHQLVLNILDLISFSIRGTIQLPFTVTNDVSMVLVDTSTLLLLGGRNNVDVVDNVDCVRGNNDVYTYNTVTGVFTNIGSISSIPTTVCKFQTVLRKDGSVVIYDSCEYKDTAVSSTYYVLTLKPFTVTAVSSPVNTNMFTTIKLSSGQVLRVTAKPDDPQVVFVDNTNKQAALLGDISTYNTPESVLTVDVGDVVEIDNPYIYTRIVILGDSDSNTGLLKWMIDGAVTEFRYNDLIVTRTGLDLGGVYGYGRVWNTVTVLSDVVFDISSVLYTGKLQILSRSSVIVG